VPFSTKSPTIPLDEIRWDDISQEEGAETRLLAHIRIGALDMHLEAREVTEDAQDFQTTVEYPDDHGTMCDIAGTTFQTLEIKGRRYFLFALPYGD
jgi:hypothetical protein